MPTGCVEPDGGGLDWPPGRPCRRCPRPPGSLGITSPAFGKKNRGIEFSYKYLHVYLVAWNLLRLFFKNLAEIPHTWAKDIYFIEVLFIVHLHINLTYNINLY